MKRQKVARLIFITSMGIYNEIPNSIGVGGNLEYNPVLRPYRDAADKIETTDLDYTIIRPGKFMRGPGYIPHTDTFIFSVNCWFSLAGFSLIQA